MSKKRLKKKKNKIINTKKEIKQKDNNIVSIIYMRKSTKLQEFTNQEFYFKEKNINPTYIFKESFTGTTKERPEFNKMLDLIKDLSNNTSKQITVYTKAVDRLARSTKDLLEIINLFDELNVSADLGNMTYEPNNPMSKFVLTTLGAVAELELSIRSNRAKESIKEYWDKKAPNGITPEKLQAYHDLNDYLKNTGKSINYAFNNKICNISKPTYYKIKKTLNAQK